MEQAIQKVREVGYFPLYSVTGNEKPVTAKEAILLDPLFWQALGKALGLGVQIGDYKGDVHVNHESNGGNCTELCIVPSVKIWHSFIDHLAEGKSADSFFKELIK